MATDTRITALVILEGGLVQDVYGSPAYQVWDWDAIRESGTYAESAEYLASFGIQVTASDFAHLWLNGLVEDMIKQDILEPMLAMLEPTKH